MTNYIKLNHKKRQLIQDRTFARNASIVGSKEYNLLQQAKRDYPDYEVCVKSIRKNSSKTTYSGLTYDYMKEYINRYGEDKQAELKELDDMIFLSKCHKKQLRYPTIKKWFLSNYPEVKDFLNTAEETPELKVVAAAANEIDNAA